MTAEKCYIVYSIINVVPVQYSARQTT